MAERLASLISGTGTTMEAIVRACDDGTIPDTVVGCVIASKPGIPGIERARRAGIHDRDVIVVNPKSGIAADGRVDDEAFARSIISECARRDITVITQNGWLPRTPSAVIEEFRGRIFNQHPGPVPEFGGKGMYGDRVHDAVLLFLRMTGNPLVTHVIAQHVGNEYDSGGVVGRAVVSVEEDDTSQSLHARTLPHEIRLQIALLQTLARGEALQILPQESFALSHQMEALAWAKETAATRRR